MHFTYRDYTGRPDDSRLPSLPTPRVSGTSVAAPPQNSNHVRYSLFSPLADRGGRVIATDTLRILLVLQVPSDGQKCEQGCKDNPNTPCQRILPIEIIPVVRTIRACRVYRLLEFQAPGHWIFLVSYSR